MIPVDSRIGSLYSSFIIIAPKFCMMPCLGRFKDYSIIYQRLFVCIVFCIGDICLLYFVTNLSVFLERSLGWALDGSYL